ncbi:hypothetical protein AKJ45_01975 [candidate division MSBL1 archaeon SCGC-AAA261F19]|uniref:GIY-YIG domain-containing protein n=1 Tax=candidate division MSBL1 archaeon SCGC-AAA261F19 TaxID=1698275 RepID=A0A133VA49_9EURY|nr:hypothetical protein AKJ45_01975 [candidate division MSBL1 archaeon SCGC-AAA261F19]
MDSSTVYSKIKALHDWLIGQKIQTGIKLEGETLSWMSLDLVTPKEIPNKPGFYVVRLKKSESPDIVYIGETNNLRRRVNFFRGAIRRGTAPHSGGKNLRSELGSELAQFEICWITAGDVYVAKVFEWYLVLSFYKEHNRLPIGNKE